MKSILLAATILSAASLPAAARLQLSINANGATFSCFDGELGCDQSGGANNLLLVNTSVGGAFVEIALSTSAFGNPNLLTLSSNEIDNVSGKPISITMVASDNNYVAPVNAITESSSLTFNNAVGSGASFEKFWADTGNVQGANPLNTPGALLFTATGTPVQNPDSFEGTHLSPFAAFAPFSMTEAAQLNLITGGSVTGFSQNMQSHVKVIPEPRTWVMLLAGFGLMALMGRKVKRRLEVY